MTTYNSYEAAKIANPESDIYRVKSSSIGGYVALGASDFIELNDGDESSLCNPADHCMTVEKFLADGHKFVRGDVVDAGKVGVIETGFEINAYNEPDGGDSSIFILRAAALEEKPKRTKVDLKLANYATVSSAIKAHEDGIKFVRLLPDGDTEDLSWFGLCECYANGYKIRVKVETEIDERQEFIEAVSEALPEYDKRTMPLWIGRLYDSGKFKLVEGE